MFDDLGTYRPKDIRCFSQVNGLEWICLVLLGEKITKRLFGGSYHKSDGPWMKEDL